MNNETRKERFEKLLKLKSTTQMDLYRKILKALKCKDPIETAEKNKANFGKMISGERPFKEEYIPYLERFLETTYDYIINGTGNYLNFKSKGIRYAAYADKKEDYEELLTETSSKNEPLFNYDEFDKTILDYIIEYKAKNGLEYLVENGYISLYLNGKDIISSKNISGEKKGIDVLDLILELDDSRLFEKFTSIWDRYEGSPYELGILKDQNTIIKILGTENIISSLFETRKRSLKDINNRLFCGKNDIGIFCNPLLYHIANYILLNEREYPKQVEELLKFGIRHNAEVISYIKEKCNHNEDMILDDKGYIKVGSTIYGSLLFYKLEEQPDLAESTYRLLSQLNSIIDDFKFDSAAMNNGYSKSPVRLENGKIIKKTTANSVEYQFFNNMKGKDLPFLPRLECQKDGLDYFSYLRGHTESMVFEQNQKRIDGITRILKVLNNSSKSMLGIDNVYVHGDLSPMNVVFDGDEVVGIIDWDNVKVGYEYEDLIYVMWDWLNIGSLARDNKHIFEGVKHILDIYGASDGLKKNWADKMIEVMEARLSKADKTESNYERIFTWVKQSEIWVELYRDRIIEEIG